MRRYMLITAAGLLLAGCGTSGSKAVAPATPTMDAAITSATCKAYDKALGPIAQQIADAKSYNLPGYVLAVDTKKAHEGLTTAAGLAKEPLAGAITRVASAVQSMTDAYGKALTATFKDAATELDAVRATDGPVRAMCSKAGQSIVTVL